MNIALIGYGRMGHEIEEAVITRGHIVSLKVDKDNTDDICREKMAGVDVAIEFSTPETAFGNISKCLSLKIPVVSGTTGWLTDYDKAAEQCRINNTSFIHSTNFSIGVNLLFRLNAELAKQMARYNEYDVAIEEIHHTRKLDAPSGTAISLAEGITKQHSKYKGWCFEKDNSDNMIPVRSVREGSIPGTHIVMWDSDVDTLSLKHEARNRKGLALGAVLAAEFISTRKGVFIMDDVLGF
jgi:4-hydroxy-tetrahydrodipicolinate reductase